MRLVPRPILAAVVLCAFAVSGCGVGTGGSTVPAPANHGPTARHGSLVLHIRVPRKAKKHRHRGAHYLSPLTQSITLAITGPTPFATTAPLTPTSQGCASTLASTLCTLTIPNLEPGSYAGAVSTWDTTAGTGNELSANQSVSFDIVPGQNNAIGIDLGGIPTSAVLLPAAGSTLSGNATSGYTLSKCGSDTVNVYAEDYEGNIILGAGAPIPSLQSDSGSLGVTAPPSSSPNAFTITRSWPPPLPATTVHLTATVTPDDDTGAEPVATSAIAMTFNHDLCGYFTQYPSGVPSGTRLPGMVAGTDGNLWFTDATNNAIGKVTTDGVVTEYSTGISAGAYPDAITVGPDGNVWFTEFLLGNIATMATDGTITEFPAAGNPSGIATGADKRLWFTIGGGQAVIGAITTAGTFTEYTSGLHGSPNSVAEGPDGNVWFTESDITKVGKISTTGVVHEYGSGITHNSTPVAITAGPDGNMWFAESAGGPAKVTTAGVITQYSPTGSTGDDIAAGPDGNVWLTYGSGVVTKITPSGVATNYTVPNTGFPLAITAGPDGYMWITQQINGMIDRIQ